MPPSKTTNIAGKKSQSASGKISDVGKGKITPLSEERIVDSDTDTDLDSSSESAPQTKAVVPQETSALQNASKSIVASPTESGTHDSSTDSSSSEESSDEDTSESDEAPDAFTKHTVPENSTSTTNGVKRKTSSTDLDSTHSSEEEEQQQQPKSKKARMEDEQSSISSSDSSPESTSRSAEAIGQASQPKSSADGPLLVPRAAPKYEAPHGYRAVDMSQSAAVSPRDLAEKSVWHITAPVGIPLTSLTSLVWSEVQAGTPVLTHDNVKYVFTEADNSDASVMIPSAGSYHIAPQKISKSYTLRPQFTLPRIPARAAAHDAGSLAAGNIATAAVKAIRPQPEGLRMRYKPPGFGKGNPGVIGGTDDEDDDDEEIGTIFQFPKAAGPSTDGDGVKVADSVIKKKRKDKHKNKLDHAPNGLGQHVEPRAKTPTKVPEMLDKMSSAHATSTTSADDEDARRRAEKKAKKAAKRKALAGAL